MGVDVEAGMRRSNSTYSRSAVASSSSRWPGLQSAKAATASSRRSGLRRPHCNRSLPISAGSRSSRSEFCANATFDAFKLGGGTARLFVNAETRKEDYADSYDSLSEAGVVLGSAGNSAGGTRKVGSASSELVMPISKQLEVTLAAR